jgi:type IV secretion system protein VirB4
MKFFKRKAIKESVCKKEISQTKFIPFKGHWDETTVITKNKELVSVIKVEGFSFETADDEDLDVKKQILNTLLKSVGMGDYALYFHIVRKRDFSEVAGDFENEFCHELNEKWKEKHKDKISFKNDIFITVIKKEDTEGTVGATVGMMNKISKAADKDAEDIDLREAAKSLKEVCSRLVGSLKSYKPKLLGIRENEKGSFSEILEFFGMIINGGVHSNMLVPTINADSYLSKQRIYFGKTALELRDEKGHTRFGGAVSIKEYPPATNAGMLDALLQLPFEMIITHAFYFSNRANALTAMQLQQNRMRSAGDKAISQTESLTIAMDMAQSGEISFGRHHMSIFVYKDTLEDLDMCLSDVYSELVNVNITPVKESMTLQGTFWAQLPTNATFIARPSVINSLNLVGLCSLHNYPYGQKENNHWGPAVTNLDTTSGTPFYFNFHVRDVGHSMIIGPTGAGKTVMLGFLAAQAQKYKPDMFFFDKDRGAEIMIRAIGGTFTMLDPSSKMGFNPLQLEDTPENREFLFEWLSALASESGKYQLSAEEKEMVIEAINGNFKIPKEARVLRNIVPFLGLEKPGTIASRLRVWHSGEARSGIFDNEEDSLSFEGKKVHGFEMAPILESPDAIGPVLLYIFHRINMTLTGSPTVIILDEAWALLDNPVFAPKIKNWLKVLRKLNGMVVFATQSPEDVANSRISETLVQQTSTQIFLANMKATSIYQDVFKLSNREYAIIKYTDPGSRYFLVKQGEDSVVAKIDLSGMNDFIEILSARADTIRILDKIREEVGDNPEIWRPIFVDRVLNKDSD